MVQHNFNGVLSHQTQQRFHSKTFPSRLLPGGILVGITVRQGGPVHLGSTPGVGGGGGYITDRNLMVTSVPSIAVLQSQEKDNKYEMVKLKSTERKVKKKPD